MGYDLITGAYDADLAQLMASGADEMEALDIMGSAGYPLSISAGAHPNAQGIEAQILARNSALVQPVKPTRAREYPIGFFVAAVAAGTQAQVITQPQVVFRGERLIVPSDIAGQFTIDDVRVGKNSQFATSVPVPARTFDEQGVGVRLRLDTAQISQQIVLLVTNIGGAPADFRATLIGSAVE